MPTINWSKKDTRLLRHVRACLTNKTVDLRSLDELLTRLEGKMEIPSDQGQKKRKVLKHDRMARVMNRITSKRPCLKAAS